ncbi:hypothetical protein [Sansalvadorimonas verongulae]|uniref:hypothetical protein n=1 Tax=Sansalvadorimonas verongulae TaxID=2172824 RepID=UPI0012BCC9B9|nr:hypothetical protein [Sansalvadorimonas verongulae]MTI14303.1 hypothetical protein [Sansalvadorimonas verongulae]
MTPKYHIEPVVSRAKHLWLKRFSVIFAITLSAIASYQVCESNDTLHIEDEPPVEYEPNISELTLQEAMGYQVIRGEHGSKLIYNPAMDQSLQGTLKLSPITATFAEVEMQHVQRVFHDFLSTRLTPAQRKLLQLYLIDELTQYPAAGAHDMAAELNQDELSTEGTAFMARMVLALYYYHIYIYRPLLDYTSNRLNYQGQEGLMIPHIITMTKHILDQFSHSKPFINALLIVPLVATLVNDAYKAGHPAMAVSAGSYAATLTLAAQFSAGILGRYTSFNSNAAGMLSSTYRSWVQRDFWQALIDGTFALHYAENKRPIILTALGAAFLQSLNLNPGNTSFGHLLDANYMMPVILSVCLTKDWSSTFITGATLLFNQFALYRTRDSFLLEADESMSSQPYWKGLLGTGVALTLTTGMYWSEFPTYQQMGQGITSLATTFSQWLGYLTFMKTVTRPDWERSGIIHSLTRTVAQNSPFTRFYPGDERVISSHTYSSKAAAIEGNPKSFFSSLTEWVSKLYSAQRPDLPADRSANSVDTTTSDQTENEEQTASEETFQEEIANLIEDIRAEQEPVSAEVEEISQADSELIEPAI